MAITPLKKEDYKDEEYYGMDADNVLDVTGQPYVRPGASTQQTTAATSGQNTASAALTNGNNYMHSSGVYFISSELAQDPPLPEQTLQKMKALFTAVDIEPANLHPSIKIA